MKLVNKIKFERCVNIIREHLEVNDNILFSNTRSMDGVDARHTLYKLCSQSSIRNNVISKHMEEKGIKVSDSNISASIKRINKLISVYHHTQYIKKLVEEGRFVIKKSLKGKQVTYHDPCYLGRGNGVYESPRDIIRKLGVNLIEMKQHKNRALCCGAGGAQMFKDAEKGDKEINILRTEQALETNAKIIATGCPYCNTMMTDGVKFHEKENQILVKDIAELIAEAENL